MAEEEQFEVECMDERLKVNKLQVVVVY